MTVHEKLDDILSKVNPQQIKRFEKTISFTASKQTQTLNISDSIPNFNELTIDNIHIQITAFGSLFYDRNDGAAQDSNDIPRVTNYNPVTGDVSLYSGLLGWKFTTSGQFQKYATSMTVFIYY